MYNYERCQFFGSVLDLDVNASPKDSGLLFCLHVLYAINKIGVPVNTKDSHIFTCVFFFTFPPNYELNTIQLATYWSYRIETWYWSIANNKVSITTVDIWTGALMAVMEYSLKWRSNSGCFVSQEWVWECEMGVEDTILSFACLFQPRQEGTIRLPPFGIQFPPVTLTACLAIYYCHKNELHNLQVVGSVLIKLHIWRKKRQAGSECTTQKASLVMAVDMIYFFF